MTDPTEGFPTSSAPRNEAEDGGATEDAELVRRTLGGSRRALGALYRRHRHAVYHLAYRLTGSEQDAEDVLQDLFVGLPRALDRYRERGRFRSWLLRVAARTALMRLRARKAPPPVEAPRVVSAEADSAEKRIVAARALAEMSDALRPVFVLAEIEGYTHGEIAEMLDISVAASRTRLHRAWAFMRDRLKE